MSRRLYHCLGFSKNNEMPWQSARKEGALPPICLALKKQGHLLKGVNYHSSKHTALAVWKGSKLSFSFYFVLLRVPAGLRWGIGLFCDDDLVPSEIVYIFPLAVTRRRLRSHDEVPRRLSWFRSLWPSQTMWAKTKAKLWSTIWSGEPTAYDHLDWLACTWPSPVCVMMHLPGEIDETFLQGVQVDTVLNFLLKAFENVNSCHAAVRHRRFGFTSRITSRIFPLSPSPHSPLSVASPLSVVARHPTSMAVARQQHVLML